MSKIVLSYCKTNKDIDLYRQYSLGKYNRYFGSKASPYNKCMEIDTEKKSHMVAFMNITKSYVHSSFEFANGSRSNKNMKRTSTLIFDFDNKERHSDWTIQDWIDSPVAKDYGWVLATSKSHSEDGDCFHVFLPIEGEITSSETYSSILRSFIDANDIKCDPAATDGARLFNPSRKSGEKVKPNYKFINNIGKALDVTELAKAVDAEAELNKRRAEALIKARGERLIEKTTYVSAKGINNGHWQVKAIINKGYNSVDIDNFKDDIVDEITRSIRIDDYSEWVSAGHAVKRYAGESGVQYWNELCDNAKEDSRKFSSFHIDADGAIQPIFKIGEDNGWSCSNELASKIIGWDRAVNNDASDSLKNSMDELYKSMTKDV